MFRFLTATATFALLAGPALADHTLPSLGLADAQRAIAAALAAQPTVKENVAVVDAGGQLVAFVRQDGAISAGLYGAIGKAVASARFGASSTCSRLAWAPDRGPLRLPRAQRRCPSRHCPTWRRRARPRAGSPSARKVQSRSCATASSMARSVAAVGPARRMRHPPRQVPRRWWRHDEPRPAALPPHCETMARVYGWMVSVGFLMTIFGVRGRSDGRIRAAEIPREPHLRRK